MYFAGAGAESANAWVFGRSSRLKVAFSERETASARFTPTMDSLARTFARRLSASASVVESTARWAPLSRTWRTRARVSTPSMATTLFSRKKSGSESSLRQFEGTWHMSRTTSPRSAGFSDWQSSRFTP